MEVENLRNEVFDSIWRIFNDRLKGVGVDI